jgi:hypothetical protein
MSLEKIAIINTMLNSSVALTRAMEKACKSLFDEQFFHKPEFVLLCPG